MTSLRRILVRGVVAPALSHPRVRAVAFHFVSQLGIHYRTSPAVTEGEPRLRRGPKAGDRLPDARMLHHGRTTYLQQHLASPHLHIVLCGPVAAWDRHEVAALVHRFPDILAITHMSRERAEQGLIDPEGEALAQLGVQHTAQYLVRPDGHVGFRCGGTDLRGITTYLDRWFASAAAT